MRKIANWFWNEQTGMAAVEYALLLAFIAGSAAIAMSALGGGVFTALGNACRSLGGPC